MKKVYLLILFLFVTMLGFSQGTLLSENFDKTFPPQDWKLIKVSGSNTWMQMYESSGNYSAGISAGTGQDSWLITPQLKPSDANHILTFWAKTNADLNSNLSALSVKVSTFKGDVSYFKSTPEFQIVSVGAAGVDSLFSKAWIKYTVDLSQYKGQGIFLGFQFTSVVGGVAARIDSVSGIPLATFDNDLVLASLTLPPKVDFKYTGDQINFSAKVKNQGIATASNVPVKFYVDGVELSTQSATISASDSATVSAQWTATAGTHYIKAVIPDDDNNINNELLDTIPIYAVGALVESFEGTAVPPLNWVSEGSWMAATYNQTHGAKCIAVFSGGKKLVTPKVNVALGDSLTFGAYVGATFAVLTSTDFLTWDTVGVYTGNYEKKNFSIHFDANNNTQYLGKRYFAFVITSQYGSLYIDMVAGSQLVNIEHDLALVSLTKTNTEFLQEGKPINYSVIVKNNGTQEQSGSVSLLEEGVNLLTTVNTKLLKQNESDTLNVSWTPNKGYPSVNVVATLPLDDADGNNSLKVNSLVYPKVAADLPFANDFDQSTVFPEYWNTDSPNGSGWKIASAPIYSPTVTPFSGKSVLAFQCYSKDTMALTSHFVNLPYNKYKVSFWLYRDGTASATSKTEYLNIYVNNTPDTVSAQFVGSVSRSTTLEPVVSASGWYFYEFFADCSALNSGFFIFEGVSVQSYQNMYIDNLSIEGIPPHDAKLINNHPSDVIVWGNKEAKHDVSVTLKNVGEFDLTQAKIGWSLDGVSQPDYAWTGSLGFRDSTNVVVAANTSLNTGINHKVEVFVSAANDTLAYNDTISYMVNAKQAIALPYLNDFEDPATSFTDWLTWDLDKDTLTWYVGSDKSFSGTSSAISASYDVDKGELTPDNWLVSPGFNMEYNKSFLSFYVGAGDDTYFDEKYEVLVSTTKPEKDEFVSIYTDSLTNSQYKKVELNLDGYKGKTIFVAFRHFDTTGQYFLSLDSVALHYPQLYTVDVAASPTEGGVVTGAGKYLLDDAVVVKATANEGYNFVNWTSGGNEVSNNPEFTFNLISDTALVANFGIIQYTITASVEGEGSITPAGSVSVNYDGSQTFEITPAEGYKIESVWVDGVDVGAVATYAFSNVTANHTIKAVLGIIQYTITASVEGEGSITPTGSVSVNYDGSQTFEITPAEGYKIESVWVDDVNMGAIATYTFSNVIANHSIKAVFDKLSSISLSGSQSLNVYPNPFVDVIYLQTTVNIKDIRIVDNRGALLYQKTVEGGIEGDYSIRVDVPKGSYILLLTYADGSVSTTKLIKH
ncbi:MAG: choice-of-anchor J domain-containing protein [Dysgonomonas sp.]